jgi:hypothetical protein
MCAGQAFHALLLEYSVQRAPGSAVGVCDEDVFVIRAAFAYRFAHTLRNLFRAVVQFRVQAPEAQMAPAVAALEIGNLAGERAAGNDEYRFMHR